MGGEPGARLSALLGAATTTQAESLTRGRATAVGWATVELDRAVAELRVAFRIPSERFAVAHDSASLGARCLVAPDVLPGGASLVVLEPNSEGRLAATLARHDEGPVAVWLTVEDLADIVRTLRRAATHLSPPQAGPFGTERLILDGPVHGPHSLLVQRPGTIPA
jgi:hypothetical protein